jgi:hypothetical protein
MSTNIPPGGVHPLQGAPQAQTELAHLLSAQERTKEREVMPRGDVSSPQPISVPKLAEGRKHHSLTSVLGHGAEEAAQNTDVGFGPRLVVLNNYVTGPAPTIEGGDRPAFSRGRVIWASQLLGEEMTQKAIEGDTQARAALRRYIEQGAVREATKQEERFTQVSFVEGEDALAADLQQTQARMANVESENTRMKRLLEAINIDPNASPEEVQRTLSARRVADHPQGMGTPQPAGGTGGSQPPPNPQTPPKEETGTGGAQQGTGETTDEF